LTDKVSLLITLLYEGSLLRCALKVDGNAFDDDVFAFPLEPENKDIIRAALPEHIKSCGPIVAVEQIFDICTAKGV